jgi:hypothetical protein
MNQLGTSCYGLAHPCPKVLQDVVLPGGGGAEPLGAEIAAVGQRASVQPHVHLGSEQVGWRKGHQEVGMVYLN